MRYVSFLNNDRPVLGVREGDAIRIVGEESLELLLARGVEDRKSVV